MLKRPDEDGEDDVLDAIPTIDAFAAIVDRQKAFVDPNREITIVVLSNGPLIAAA